MSVTTSPASPTPSPPSAVRAWFYLIWLSFQRQARARLMVWIALGLVTCTCVITGLVAQQVPWGMSYWWKQPRDTWMDDTHIAAGVATQPETQSMTHMVFGVARAIHWLEVRKETSVLVFTRTMVFGLFLSFLLPLCSLSFATEALGGDRENNSLVWLLTRPLSRPAIYLAKYLAMLPWSLALNLGGFTALCLVAGEPGWVALRLYWPAVVWATLAFGSLYFLMGALFSRPAVVAIVYSFFLEIILGNMPGTLKRVSLGFYTRCVMFEAAQHYGVEPENPVVYAPVSGDTALIVLAGATVGLLALGAWLFSRAEYHDVT